jgi:DNA repair photolyase
VSQTIPTAAERLRWSTVEQEPTLPDLGVGQRVTHPEFQGMEFLHVRAKSLLNEVPEAAGLPFRWTINVYRGCSHACTYCLAGDTPVLLADGRTLPISELRAGMEVVGTRVSGRYRRYTTTTVLDHWRTTKRAYRITLADGTQLVASGDHRFLTERGWKHVTPSGAERDQRPHLTGDDELVGTGAVADPAGTGTRSFEGRDVKGGAPLQVERIEDLGLEVPMFDITTGTGDFIANGVISHNCFARPSHTWLDLDAGRDFEKVVVVKVNAVERLRAELRRPSWQGEAVALGTNTDPYQRAEGRYRLTRGVVQTLSDAGNPFSVLTKGTLVTRDLDILADAAARGVCTGVSMSIPTLDEEVWRTSEPGTPHPRARMETIARLSEAGIPTGVMLAPIIPGMSDHPAQLEAVIQAAVEAGAGHITPILLHLRPGVREVFLPWLAEVRPDLVAAYERWYPRTYAPKVMRDALARRVHRLIARHGPLRTTSTPRLRDPSPTGRVPAPPEELTPDPDGEQLSLL